MLNDKIKALVEKKTKDNNKKTVENLVVFLVLLIVTIVAINVIWGKEKTEKKETTQENYKVLADNSNILEEKTYNLEKELAEILSKISGVGNVQVLITYSQTSEVVAMHNEEKNTSRTEETDSNRWNKGY